MLVLCVDDEPTILVVHRMTLERHGYEVLTAMNGREAIDLFSSHPVDAVLLDYLMPGMNGGDVAAQIKQVAPNTPIILISACLSVPDGVLAHVNRFFTKPCSIKQVLKELAELLASSKPTIANNGQTAA